MSRTKIILCPECLEEIEIEADRFVIEPMWKAQHDITELLTKIKTVIEKYQVRIGILCGSNSVDAEANQTIERIEEWLHDHRPNN